LRAYACAVLLGLALAAKFSLVVLPFAWITLAVVHWWRTRPQRIAKRVQGWRRSLARGVLMVGVTLAVVNAVYLCEGTGRQLGSFPLRSYRLTRGPKPESPAEVRENRFVGTFLEKLPVPLPEHYVLGLDDQLFDVDSGMFPKYLRGQWRQEKGWWYYYFYCAAVKGPLGTLGLLAAGALAACLFRSCRRELTTEAALLLPMATLFLCVSFETGLNSHFRYVLPAFPFAFVFAGRLGPLCRSGSHWWRWILIGVLALNAASVLWVHPHYLTYFNELAGGPLGGGRHLADSNIDWGQGLLALRDWLHDRDAGRKLYLAYFGTMDPAVIGIQYDPPPLDGPVPGLHAVSVNYLLGMPANALTYYRRFQPVATPGNSIYVYDLTPEQVQEARAEMGLPAHPEQQVR
jgi:4-amino-4-deoxy-L-arabinose transferase-like glycosyltransferase